VDWDVWVVGLNGLFDYDTWQLRRIHPHCCGPLALFLRSSFGHDVTTFYARVTRCSVQVSSASSVS